MARKSIGKVCLSDRDRKLLRFLFESKVASKQQIAKEVFPTNHITIVERRLRKLFKVGLVKPFSIFKDNKVQVFFSSTDKGVDEIMEISKYHIDKRLIKSDSKEHDLELVSVIQKLRTFPSVVKVFTENALKCYEDLREDDEYFTYGKLRSDGVVVFKVKESLVLGALEYDRTEKSHKRYIQKFKDYYKANQIEGVFFVCETKSMMSKLARIDQKLCDKRNSKFFFCLKEDLLSSTVKVAFSDWRGRELELS